MIPPLQLARFAVLAAAVQMLSLSAPAQATHAQQAQARPAQHGFLILLDPAHGGKDSGATLPNHLPEKEATLAFAQTLRTALTARHLASQSTRDSDLTLSPAQRAARAAQLAPAICLTLHTTATGTGIHVLYPLQEFVVANSGYLDKWSTAYVPPNHQSQPIARLLQSSLNHAHLPATSGPTADPTLAREHCVAVLVELAPLAPSNTASNPASGPAYQQQVAEVLADALDNYRAQRALLDAGASTYVRKAGPR